MSKLVILITSRVNAGHQIGEAWYEAGAPGVTFVESYGIRSLQEANKSSEVLPGVLSMFQILRQSEEMSLIVLSVVDDNAIVKRLIEATETILGDLLEPHTGLVFVLDVEQAIGIRDPRSGSKSSSS